MQKVTLWSLVVDNDGGTSCDLFKTEAERDVRCAMIMAAAWSDNGWTRPIPDDWRQAWEEIEADGCDFWISLDRHEVTFP